MYECRNVGGVCGDSENYKFFLQSWISPEKKLSFLEVIDHCSRTCHYAFETHLDLAFLALMSLILKSEGILEIYLSKDLKPIFSRMCVWIYFIIFGVGLEAHIFI